MNKKAKFVTAIAITIIALLDMAVIGLLIYEMVVLNKIESESIARTVIVVISSVLALVKMFARRGKKRSSAFYREQYKHIIGDAFSTDKKLERTFFCAIDDMNKDLNNRAIKQLRALLPRLNSNNDRFAVLFFIAFCYSEMGLYSRAIETYLQAEPLKVNSTLLSNLGMCYRNVGDFESAIGAYEDAVNIDPSNAFPYNNIAQLLLEDAEYEDALGWAIRAVEIKPDLYQAYNAQAICYAMLGDKDSYEKSLKKAVAHGSDRMKIVRYIKNLGAPIFENENSNG